jgi:hypothetical protein
VPDRESAWMSSSTCEIVTNCRVAVMRESSWMNYGADIDFDPVPVFEKLNIPVLSLLSEFDVETPVQETTAILKQITKEQ